jgi:hypothetical protein
MKKVTKVGKLPLEYGESCHLEPIFKKASFWQKSQCPDCVSPIEEESLLNITL